ncbi:hypothetical protein DPMN_025837 [Dreissena polymorpha]|uniref:Cadherin domain-containing protein n=1 Tax=Dreissena polymorpha TaxID=45954 RepID=A0A9D4RDP5_DREPO|nr:hypothetical protein DPMN_025837 [Dreissena polymorpha]
MVLRLLIFKNLLCFYKLTIQVEDGRGKKAEATVIITIVRNPSDKAPVFLNLDLDTTGTGSGSVYRATIRYDHQVGTTVSRRPSASDADLQVSQYAPWLLHHHCSSCL